MFSSSPISLRRFLRLEAAPAQVPVVSSKVTGQRSNLLHQTQLKERVTDRFPDVTLTNHRGQAMRFRSDMISDQKVLIGFIYTRCGGICPATTKHMAQVHAMLTEELKGKFRMISMSVDPARDTVDDLMEYAADKGVANHDNWDFVVGSEADTDSIRQTLRLQDPDVAADGQLRNHSGMIIFGNDRTNRWSAIPAGTRPEHIAHGFMRMTRDGSLRSILHGLPAA